MKLLLALACLVFSTGAMAGEYYYTIGPDNPTATHYSTADDGCHAAYAQDLARGAPSARVTIPRPYKAPTVTFDNPPKTLIYSCDFLWTDAEQKLTVSRNVLIYRDGDNCQTNEVYNPLTGYCEAPDKEQPRKEEGNPASSANVGFVSCGDPVNPANGNVFETETDYADQDGELRFVRSYNSADAAGWVTTFNTRVYADTAVTPRGAVVMFEDGRTALFVTKSGVLVADGGELGSLVQNSTGWVYTSQFNEQMTFDTQGRLVRWQKADGRATTLTYSTTPTYDVVATVVDSLGHQLVYTTHYGWPLSLVVGNLTIDYTVDASFRITGVKKTWPGHSTNRSYLYEDSTHPKLLTGVIYERGVRVSTWAYDASSRAVSAAMAGGKGSFSFAYNADGSTTVTNPLGHPVVYRFNIVQGAKRITAIEGEPVAGCPASNSTFAYTANAQLDSRTDAVGNTTAFTYDTQGRETSRVEAKGAASERTTTTTWDGTSFRPATVTTSDRVTTYTYDPQGRLLSTQNHSVKE
jgi:YD repeat-containing protein